MSKPPEVMSSRGSGKPKNSVPKSKEQCLRFSIQTTLLVVFTLFLPLMGPPPMIVKKITRQG